MILTCKICNTEFNSQRQLIKHIANSHTEFGSYEDYIIFYYYGNLKPTCKCGCGTPMVFESHSNPNFYKEYTKNHFPRKPHSDVTKQRIKENTAAAIMDKYGVDNIMKMDSYIGKISSTKQERYGDANFNNPAKAAQTNMKKYGVEHPQQDESIKQKSKKTNYTKYGASSFTATDAGKRKVKQTKLEKYGDSNYTNTEKMRKSKLEKYGYECEFQDRNWRTKFNYTDSGIEQKVRQDLQVNKFVLAGYEYDAILHKFIIEVDGSAYHPQTLNNMSLTQLNSVQNDFVKTNIVIDSEYSLIRISAEEMKKIPFISFEDVWVNSYEQDFSYSYYTKFVTKEYLSDLINLHDKDWLNKYHRVFLKFKKLFIPHFPTIETKEDLCEILGYIKNYKYSEVQEKVFENNTSNAGVSYLKSKFASYWKSSYKGNPSPIEAWSDDDIMARVIKYRIGINDSGEIFDFSPHQLVRGLSALRITVSFFKPVLAASIYRHFLKNKQNPVVFDPCCGFGGRLLGFKGLYPEGTYIGCEPNIETFNELCELSKNFDNVYLYNCPLEEFDMNLLPVSVDMTFTSIPYYDLETYSNTCNYESFDDWKDKFISKMLLLPNLIVNVPQHLESCFVNTKETYYIKTNTSHFNKTSLSKKELLIVC